MLDPTPALRARAGDRCELCGAEAGLGSLHVPPGDDFDHSVLVCGTCDAQIGGAPLDPKHWFCLQQSIWSEVPAVQVVSWRLLQRLTAESWVRDLLEQAYLEESVLEWARAGLEAPEEAVRTVDSNGALLADGDSVTIIKDLDVKGASFTAKRGTIVKNIRLTDNPEHVEGRVNGIGIVLKTMFLKKVGSTP